MEIFSKRENIFFLSLSDINYKFNTLKFQQTIILFYVFKHKLALSHLPKYWDLGSYHNWQEKPLLLITTKYLIWSISILFSSHAYSLLSLVSEALLLPGFGQVALNDIHINCQVAPTQKMQTNYSVVLDAQKCWTDCAKNSSTDFAQLPPVPTSYPPVVHLLQLGSSICS